MIRSNLNLGNDLTIHGSLGLYGSNITLSNTNAGRILVTESGSLLVDGQITLDLDLISERGGVQTWYGGTYGENFLRGSGQIENSGLIKVEQYGNDFSLGVDVVNDGVFDLRFTNSGTTTSTFSLQAGAGVTLQSTGRLVASTYGSNVIALNDNTLDVRQGEMALFASAGLSTNDVLTLSGGASAAAPGVIQLEETVFEVSARSVRVEVQPLATAGEFTLYFVVSDGGNLTDAEVTTTGATLGSLGTKTDNSDGTATYSATLTRSSGNTGDITVTVSDNPLNDVFGGTLTLNNNDVGTFVSNNDSGELKLTGHLAFELTGTVDFFDDDAGKLTLQGSTADSIRLSNSTTETAVLVNSETIYFNNLTVDTNVILVNSVGPDAYIDSGTLVLSGTSVIDGDLYNVSDPDAPSGSTGGLYLLNSVTANGVVLNQANSRLFIGRDPFSTVAESTTVALSLDFVNEGYLTIGEITTGSAHLVKIGTDAVAGTLTNSGYITIDSNTSGSAEIDGLLINTGNIYSSGHWILDATSINAEHHSSGIIELSGSSGKLTLGNSDTLVIDAAGYLVVGSNGGTSVIDASASGAALQLSGTLAIGDTIFTTNGVEAPQLSEVVGQLTIDTSSAFTVNPNSTVKVGVTFGGSNDALIVTGTAGVLRLEGGLLSVASGFSSNTSAALITATSILGSFDTIDGLVFLANIGERTVADVVQTATGITLTPVSNASGVLAEGDGTGSVFDFSASASITHYLAAGGDDLIKGVESGDSAFGEAGDDTFVLNSVAINRIDGGSGIDQIVLPGTVNFDFTKEGVDNTLGTADDWLGHRFERIELLSMEDATNQTMALDASALRSINDGANGLLNDEAGLVVKGNMLGMSSISAVILTIPKTDLPRCARRSNPVVVVLSR